MTSAARPRSIELVAAVAANGVIGVGGGLPWKLPDDLKHFKELTVDHAVIMGRRTFDEIGRKPLPRRLNIVVSRSTFEAEDPNVRVVSNIDDAIAAASTSAPPIFVVGGATIYEQTLPIATRLHLTELDDDVEGDTHFPTFDRSQWRVASESRHERDDRHPHAFTIRVYERNS